MSTLPVAQRLAAIREALATVTRAPQMIAICGVTKAQPAAVVEEAVRAGVHCLGNNYAQEGAVLREALAAHVVEWHFIGHIQSRKAKYLVDYSLVQSLDRSSVAAALDARLAVLGRELGVLVEVNVGGEAQKSGVSPADLERFLDELRGCSQLKVRGLMAMPPPKEPVEARRPYFRQMRELYDRYAGKRGFDTLSMGTSADYLVAVAEGATMIRLGTTLFGTR